MQIKNNAQILVIDDNYKEVKNLLMTLAKNGLSYVYNNGSYRMRPGKRNLYTGVRFIILDTDIKKLTSGMPPANKASTLVTYLTEIISEKNGPIFILFCTKDESIIDEVKKNFARSKLILAGYEMLDKDANGVAGREAIAKLHSAINSDGLPHSFKFFLSWEQNANRTQSSFIDMLSSLQSNELSDLDEKVRCWDADTQNILCKLIESNANDEWENIRSNQQNLAYTIRVLNQSFAGKLPKEGFFFPLPSDYSVSLDVVAKMNTCLFLDDLIEKKKIETGKVYYETNAKKLADLKNAIIENEFLSSCRAKLITAIVTPQCDIAQANLMQRGETSDNTEWHNFLSGLEIEIDGEDYKKMIKKANGYKKKITFIDGLTVLEEVKRKKLKKYITPSNPGIFFKTFPLQNNEKKNCIWIFHFSTICSRPVKKSGLHFEYQMSKELFFDLQSKLSNYLNRLGNSMLEL